MTTGPAHEKHLDLVPHPSLEQESPCGGFPQAIGTHNDPNHVHA